MIYANLVNERYRKQIRNAMNETCATEVTIIQANIEPPPITTITSLSLNKNNNVNKCEFVSSEPSNCVPVPLITPLPQAHFFPSNQDYNSS
eukprot:Awhi_evm2s12636